MNGNYNQAIRLLREGQLTNAEDFRVLLLDSTSTYEFNPDHDTLQDLFSNGAVEISAVDVPSYARTALANVAWSDSDANDLSYIDADDPSFGSLEDDMGTIVKAIVFFVHVTNDSDSIPLRYIDGKSKITVAAPAIGATETGSITGISQANPAVVTSVSHGLSTGKKVRIGAVGGMIQVRNKSYIVTVIDADTFSIPVDSTGYPAYTSGGEWHEVRKVFIHPSKSRFRRDAAVNFSNGGITGINDAVVNEGDLFIWIVALSSQLNEGDISDEIDTSTSLPKQLSGGEFRIILPSDGFLSILNR